MVLNWKPIVASHSAKECGAKTKGWRRCEIWIDLQTAKQWSSNIGDNILHGELCDLSSNAFKVLLWLRDWCQCRNDCWSNKSSIDWYGNDIGFKPIRHIHLLNHSDANLQARKRVCLFSYSHSQMLFSRLTLIQVCLINSIFFWQICCNITQHYTGFHSCILLQEGRHQRSSQWNWMGQKTYGKSAGAWFSNGLILSNKKPTHSVDNEMLCTANSILWDVCQHQKICAKNKIMNSNDK